mgnify:CR=1 FL=1
MPLREFEKKALMELKKILEEDYGWPYIDYNRPKKPLMKPNFSTEERKAQGP